MSLVGKRCLILPLYLWVITYMRREWSTALASLISLPLHAWHNHLPSFIYRLGEQGHLRAPAKVHSFFPVSLLIFWEADGCCESRTPLQTQSHTTCRDPRNDSYNSCILICHCLTPAVEKHHLKTQWETCVGTCDTAGGLVVLKGDTLNHNTCFILCAIRRTSLLPSSETWPHTEICSLSLALHNGSLKIEGKEWPLTVFHTLYR